MNERTKQILEDAARWGGEAWKEWADSVKDSPDAHCYTLIVGALCAVVVWWFL